MIDCDYCKTPTPTYHNVRLPSGSVANVCPACMAQRTDAKTENERLRANVDRLRDQIRGLKAELARKTEAEE